MNELTGHCLCGDISFAIAGSALQVVHCHCESCRRATSSPVTTFLIVRRADLRYTHGTPAVYASSPGVRRSFCARCGSPLGYESDRRSDQIDLYVCSLDNPAVVAPTAHMHIAERVPWFDTLDDLPRYAKTPRDGGPIRHRPG